MEGKRLKSISGRSDIELVRIDHDYERLELRTTAGSVKYWTLAKLRQIVEKMALNAPVHVDSVLGGGGSSRNQPETVLANMPDVEWLLLNDHKHIVWVGKQTHDLGTLKQVDPWTQAQLSGRYQGQGKLAGRQPAGVLVLANDLRAASSLVTALLQGPPPSALPGGKAYLVSTESTEVVMVPQVGSTKLEVLPLVKVADRDEAFRRIAAVFPGTTRQEVGADRDLVVIRLAGGVAVAVE